MKSYLVDAQANNSLIDLGDDLSEANKLPNKFAGLCK